MHSFVRSRALPLVIGASLGLGLLGAGLVPLAGADESQDAAIGQDAAVSKEAADTGAGALSYSSTLDADGGEATVTVEVLDGKIVQVDIDSDEGVSLDDLSAALADCAAQAGLDEDQSGEDGSSGQETSGSASQGTPQVLGVADVDWLVNQQPLHVINTKLLVQSDQYKALYPDLLSATIENTGTDDIRDVVVAFAAWDANGLPVKIKGQFSFNDGVYIALVNLDAINMVPGSTYGENSGLALDQDCNSIATFKATVVSYTRFDGTTWENPYYDLWEKMYEGVKYTDDMTIEAVVD